MGGSSGGATIHCALHHTTIDPAALTAMVAHPAVGAVALFIGTVREKSGAADRPGEVIRLEYEAYEPMALSEMEAIAREVAERYDAVAVAVEHCLGILEVGRTAVGIAVGTPHRSDAFAACREIIEEIKQRVPIWKKEVFQDGAEWVDPRP